MEPRDLIPGFRRQLATGYSEREFLFLLASTLVAGLARGFSGFGAALIFMPLASAVVGPRLAAPLLLIIDAIAAVGLIPDAWQRSDRRGVGIMAIGAIVGVPVGTLLLTMIDPHRARWVIALIVIALLILLISGWRYRGQPSALLTVGIGTISGLFTGAAQIGGPPVVAYWLGGSIPSATVRANIVLYFAISTLLTGASYLLAGLITQPVLLLALTTAPYTRLGVVHRLPPIWPHARNCVPLCLLWPD